MLCERTRAELCSDLLARLGTRVDDRDELAPCGLGIFLRVKAPEVPHADHGGSYFLHRDGIMPAPMSSPPPRQAAAPPSGRPLSLPTDLRAAPRTPPPVPPQMPPRVRRELIMFGAALLFGLIGVPLLIWVGGNRVLGPYVHGQNLHAGPFALLQDFFLGLLHGSAVFWAVALGPAALLLLGRLFIALLRGQPR